MNDKNELQVVNSTYVIQNITSSEFVERSNALKEFKDFISNELVDGVDYGLIPKTTRPCLFKPGGEKIQMYLGLTPQYRLLNREFLQNQKRIDNKWNNITKKYEIVESIRNYYSWEWACELWYNDKKIAEGVGAGNSEERKWVNQYLSSGENPDSLSNTIMKISKKRAFMDAIIAVSGISDIFTQDLLDDNDFNKSIEKLKVNKNVRADKLSRNDKKTLYANLAILNMTSKDLDEILAKFKYKNINEVKKEDLNNINEEIKNMAKSQKGE